MFTILHPWHFRNSKNLWGNNVLGDTQPSNTREGNLLTYITRNAGPETVAKGMVGTLRHTAVQMQTPTPPSLAV